MTKDEKIKKLTDALQDIVDCSPVSYAHEDDECGACSFCGRVSYRPHAESCEIKKAEKLLKELKS